MKRIKYALLAAALTAASVVVPAAGKAEAAGATWKKDAKGWWVSYGGASYAKSEWVGGYWLRANGYWDGVSKKATWKKDSKGWWYGYAGWYAKSQWQLIDGKWYFFDKRGYMAKDCYVDGYYVGKDGAWDGGSKFHWGQTDGKWWYGNKAAKSFVTDRWAKISGLKYHFDSEGYMCAEEVEKIGKKIYSFNADGQPDKFTAVFAGTAVEATLEFELTDATREKAGEDLNFLLVTTTLPGTRKAMTFNGVTKVVEHVSAGTDYITVGGVKLVDYLKQSSITKVTVSGKGTVDKLLDKLTVAASVNVLYAQKVTVGGVAFTEFQIKDNVVSFKADGKKVMCLLQEKNGTATGELGYFYTDVTKKGFFDALKSAGVFGNSIVYTSTFPE